MRRLGEPGFEADRIANRQRWDFEAAISAVEHRCGEALTVGLDVIRRTQASMRGVAFNLQHLAGLAS